MFALSGESLFLQKMTFILIPDNKICRCMDCFKKYIKNYISNFLKYICQLSKRV